MFWGAGGQKTMRTARCRNGPLAHDISHRRPRLRLGEA
jgi:hypothetical protein